MLLLDTHAFVWLASEPSLLSKTAREAIRAERNGLLLSAVSAWEIALLAKRGRLVLPLVAGEFTRRAMEHAGVGELPLSIESAERAVRLPDHHRDPFDRVLVAEALWRGMGLVTRDAVLQAYAGLRIVW